MTENQFEISGNIVDIINRRIFKGTLAIENGKITGIKEKDTTSDHFIMPGFIDAHIHIESSMLIPSEFARLAVVHGTVGTVSDPHEIANVLGLEGIDFMIKNGNEVPFKFYFGAPSCVPATEFESTGAEIDATLIEELMNRKEIKYLSEFMNFPGVINCDKEVMKKINSSLKRNKPVDGHAPGLRGTDAKKYIEAGISTDHECFTKEEALEKIALGMKIIIREGSAAKNFDALIDLMDQHPDKIMFCSDDKHPNDLVCGHINKLVAKAIKLGKNKFDVLKAACMNPVIHYNLDIGQLKIGDPADFIIVNNLSDFDVNATYINGKLVAKNGSSMLDSIITNPINKFNCSPIKIDQIKVKQLGNRLRAIEVIDRQLITREYIHELSKTDEFVQSDIENDILKLVVINRFENKVPAVAFVKNFGFKNGAIAGSIAHDSHNIIAVGVHDEDIINAVNNIIKHKGGVSVSTNGITEILHLPVAGLMTHLDGYQTAEKYDQLDRKARELGSQLSSPFMTLSFLALLVIPELKLSDLGLFDAKSFQFVDLFVNKNNS